MEGASRTTESELSSPSLPACSAKDRALLLALALKWRKESKTATLTPDELQECERQIWVEHIRAAMETSSVGAACIVDLSLCKYHFTLKMLMVIAAY